MWETRKLKQHEEDELRREMLPQQLARASDIGIKVLLGFRALHGVHHQVDQLLLQNRAALLLLKEGRRRGVLKDEEEGSRKGRS